MSVSDRFRSFSNMVTEKDFIQYVERLLSGTTDLATIEASGSSSVVSGINRPLGRLAMNTDALRDAALGNTNAFLVEGGSSEVAFGLNSSNKLKLTSVTVYFPSPLGSATNNIVSDVNSDIADGEVAYVTLDRTTSGASVSVVISVWSVYTVAVAASLDVLAIAYRNGSNLHLRTGQTIRKGEKITGGENTFYSLRSYYRQRVGIFESAGTISYALASSTTEYELTLSATVSLHIPSVTVSTIAAATHTTADLQEYMWYVEVDRASGGVVTLVKALNSAISTTNYGASDDFYFFGINTAEGFILANGVKIALGDLVNFGAVTSKIKLRDVTDTSKFLEIISDGTGAGDRTLTLDVEGGDRTLTLDGDLTTAGGDFTVTLDAARELSISDGDVTTSGGSFTVASDSKTLTLDGDLDVEAASVINQDVTKDATPEFAGLLLTASSDRDSANFGLAVPIIRTVDTGAYSTATVEIETVFTSQVFYLRFAATILNQVYTNAYVTISFAQLGGSGTQASFTAPAGTANIDTDEDNTPAKQANAIATLLNSTAAYGANNTSPTDTAEIIAAVAEDSEYDLTITQVGFSGFIKIDYFPYIRDVMAFHENGGLQIHETLDVRGGAMFGGHVPGHVPSTSSNDALVKIYAQRKASGDELSTSAYPQLQFEVDIHGETDQSYGNWITLNRRGGSVGGAVPASNRFAQGDTIGGIAFSYDSDGTGSGAPGSSEVASFVVKADSALQSANSGKTLQTKFVLDVGSDRSDVSYNAENTLVVTGKDGGCVGINVGNPSASLDISNRGLWDTNNYAGFIHPKVKLTAEDVGDVSTEDSQLDLMIAGDSGQAWISTFTTLNDVQADVDRKTTAHPYAGHLNLAPDQLNPIIQTHGEVILNNVDQEKSVNFNTFPHPSGVGTGPAANRGYGIGTRSGAQNIDSLTTMYPGYRYQGLMAPHGSFGGTRGYQGMMHYGCSISATFGEQNRNGSDTSWNATMGYGPASFYGGNVVIADSIRMPAFWSSVSSSSYDHASHDSNAYNDDSAIQLLWTKSDGVVGSWNAALTDSSNWASAVVDGEEYAGHGVYYFGDGGVTTGKRYVQTRYPIPAGTPVKVSFMLLKHSSWLATTSVSSGIRVLVSTDPTFPDTSSAPTVHLAIYCGGNSWDSDPGSAGETSNWSPGLQHHSPTWDSLSTGATIPGTYTPTDTSVAHVDNDGFTSDPRFLSASIAYGLMPGWTKNDAGNPGRSVQFPASTATSAAWQGSTTEDWMHISAHFLSADRTTQDQVFGEPADDQFFHNDSSGPYKKKAYAVPDKPYYIRIEQTCTTSTIAAQIETCYVCRLTIRDINEPLLVIHDHSDGASTPGSGTGSGQVAWGKNYIRFESASGGYLGGVYRTSGSKDWQSITHGQFTGSHTGVSAEGVRLKVGSCVRIKSVAPFSGEAIYEIEPTSSSKDPAALGVYSGKIPVPEGRVSTNFLSIQCIGNGYIRVCNEGGNIAIGDYLCSSGVEGCAMKQDDDLLHNYTLAKATEPVDWSTLEDSEGNPITQKKISCTYHAG